MRKELERHKNVDTFFTARNAAIMIVEYKRGFEYGIDIPDELRRIKKFSNINKLHIYLDFKLRCDNEYCYSEKLIRNFIENITAQCTWILGGNIKVILHILQSQIVHNQIKRTTLPDFITVAEMINDIREKFTNIQIQYEDKMRTYALSKDKILLIYYKPTEAINTTNGPYAPIELQIFTAKLDRGD